MQGHYYSSQDASFSPTVRQDLHGHFFARELVPVAHSEAQRFAQTTQPSGAISPETKERKMENVMHGKKQPMTRATVEKELGMWESLTCNAGSLHAGVHAAAGNLLLFGGLEEDVKEKPGRVVICSYSSKYYNQNKVTIQTEFRDFVICDKWSRSIRD